MLDNNNAQSTNTKYFLQKLLELLFNQGFTQLSLFSVTLDKLTGQLVETIHRSPSIALDYLTHTKDPWYLPTHSINTAIYSCSAALAMDFSDADIHTVTRGALLHDAGMEQVPRKIFYEDRPLTVEELFLVQQHPEYGMKNLSYEDESIRKIVLSHHEKFKGGGYPHGTSWRFSGNKLSEIVSIADAFDAMTSHRVYRPKLSNMEARLNLMRESDSNWSNEGVEAFLRGLNRLNFQNSSNIVH